MRAKSITRIGAALAAMLALASAQRIEDRTSADSTSPNTRPSIFEKVGIDQRLGASVPLTAQFTDESGQAVTLDQYFHHRRPVLLALVYYDCPMLCNQVLNGMTGALRVLRFSAGQEFDVLAVSFDPREGPQLAAEKRALYLKRYGREGSVPGWHFLTGKPQAIKALTEAVGFRYLWDEQTKQFAHASGLVLLTPEGKVAQYYYGIEYSPKDMRLGMIEASQEKIGNVADQLLLYCYHYDPMTGRYGARIMTILRAGAIATLVILGSFIAASVRRDHRTHRALAGLQG